MIHGREQACLIRFVFLLVSLHLRSQSTLWLCLLRGIALVMLMGP